MHRAAAAQLQESVRAAVADAPASSVTVSVAVTETGPLNVRLTVAPVRTGPSLYVHRCEVITPSLSEEPDPSKAHVAPLQWCVATVEGAALTGVVDGVTATCPSRLGVPSPSPVSTPLEASATSVSVTEAGDSVGVPERCWAASPATCGAAIDVPDRVTVEVADAIPVETIPEPGARRSRQVPKFE
jgi:hypothetical protein